MSANPAFDIQAHSESSMSNFNPMSMSVPDSIVPKKKSSLIHQYILPGIFIVLLSVILIVVCVILSRLSTEKSIVVEKNQEAHSTMTLSNSIELEHMLIHLRQLQSRAIGTEAFNDTVDYLDLKLREADSFNIEKYYFSVPRQELAGPPILLALPNVSNSSVFDYPKDLTTVDRSASAANWSKVDGKPLSIVARLGCYIDDWKYVKPGDVALVRRGNCTFYQKIYMAINKQASACLIFNDGLTFDRLAPLNFTRAPRNNTIPVLFLSYEAGMRLILENTTKVYVNIEFRSLTPAIVTNICADTKFGEINRTIVVGSHSDSVAAGPGLNDNGSGMVATLAIALNLAKLIRSHNYSSRLRSRLKFCWWGGEEAGLLGSIDFVRRAKADGSLKMYSVNLNFDMLGSPNFIFGIYDGKTADNSTTPVRALPGSNRITRLFVDYFDKKRLPWDYTEFSGRSDYGPFLAEGIACGGLFSGADDVKTQEQRDRYLKMLGPMLGGMANTDLDPCYHSKCDTIENLNTFAYLHMVQAAAHSIDFLASLEDLNKWLYPASTSKNI